MNSQAKFVVITFEAAFEINKETGINIASTLDDLRGNAAARAIAARFLITDKEYDDWYRNHGIRELEIPVPQLVVFD